MRNAQEGRAPRSRVRVAAVLLFGLLLAGCVAPPEQRFVVRLFEAEGASVFLPVPLDDADEIPKFVKDAEFVKGRGTFAFTGSEHGPGIRFDVPLGGGDDVVFSGRTPGSLDLRLSTEVDGTAWVWSDREGVRASVVAGHTLEPDCPETLVEAAWGVPGWLDVPVVTGSRCA